VSLNFFYLFSARETQNIFFSTFFLIKKENLISPSKKNSISSLSKKENEEMEFSKCQALFNKRTIRC